MSDMLERITTHYGQFGLLLSFPHIQIPTDVASRLVTVIVRTVVVDFQPFYRDQKNWIVHRTG